MTSAPTTDSQVKIAKEAVVVNGSKIISLHVQCLKSPTLSFDNSSNTNLRFETLIYFTVFLHRVPLLPLGEKKIL